MKIKIRNTKTEVAVCRCIISQIRGKERTGYVITTMNCYPRNG